MAIYLMGHGLVAVPRRLFRNANLAMRLRRIQTQAPKINDRLTDATTELEELEAQLTQLRKRKNAVSRDHEEWIEDISDASILPDSRLSAITTRISSPQLPAVITDRYLADFSRKLMRARHKRIRFGDAWDKLINESVDVQAIIDASTSKRLDFGKASPNSSQLECVTIFTPYTRYLLYSKAVPTINVLHGVLFSVASACIVWSELVKFIAPKLSIISLTVLSYSRREVSEVGFGGQLIAALWLLYMSLAALSSFEDIKIWGNRALVYRNTYGESAVWYSAQIAKLTVPLAYNFLTFFPPELYHETSFYNFLGKLINLTPLGTSFDYFFPILILVPVCATLLNLYGRVRGVFGFGILEDDDQGTSSALKSGGWREGRDLINRELQGAVRLGLTPQSNGISVSLPPSSHHPLPNSETPTSSSRPAVRRQSTYAQRQAQRLAEATAAAEEDDESFFQGFAHRVKNTFDSVERPAWLDDLGKRPKWMRGVDGNDEDSARAEAGRGLGRWFGGRLADGRVRL